MSVSIEAASHHDLGALGTLLQQLFAIEEDFHFDTAKVQRALVQLLGDPRACLLVARRNGQVVGMCSAQLVISTAEGAYSAWVEDVVVDSALRGQGIGQRLLEEIAAWAQGQGATRLQLLADLENKAALDFYRRSGWQRTQLVTLRTKPQ
jgi:ribosomal protein S18 acetylase RimI-like enzyme